jgi:hypothetical protein
MADNEVKVTFTVDDQGTTKVAKINQAFDKSASSVKNMEAATKKASMSMADLWGAFSLAEKGLQVLKQGYDATVGSAMKYAGSVRDLSLVSGTGAEETSRLLQVLDDFEVSAEDVNTAVRKMTQQGIVPTTESLAQLSDEYLAINDPMERNKFILDNLGRSGLQWVNVLQQGGDAIRDLSDGVSENLILTDAQIAMTERNRLAMDNLADAQQGLAIATGNALIPVQIQWMDLLQDIFNTLDGNAPVLAHATEQTLLHRDANDGAVRSYTAWAQALEQGKPALDQATTDTAELEEQIKAMSDENKQFVSTLETVAGNLDEYNKGISQADAALAAGEITVDEHTAKVAALGAQYEQTRNQILLSLLEMKYTADGVFDDTELIKYLNGAERLGIITEAQRQETIALYGEVNTLDGSLSNVGKDVDAMADAAADANDPIKHVGARAREAGFMFGDMGEGAVAMGDDINGTALPAVAGLKSSINGLHDKEVNVDVYINVHGNQNFLGPGANTTTTNSAVEDLREDTGGGRAAGGPLYKGWTLVGERGYELISPSGYVYPHGQSAKMMEGGFRPGQARMFGGDIETPGQLIGGGGYETQGQQRRRRRDQGGSPITGASPEAESAAAGMAADTADFITPALNQQANVMSNIGMAQVTGQNAMLKKMDQQISLLKQLIGTQSSPLERMSESSFGASLSS